MSTTVTIKMTPQEFDYIREALEYALLKHRADRDQAARDNIRQDRLDHDILANEIERILKNTLA